MTISFKDIMQKFYDDEKLGIKNEDAPANEQVLQLQEQVTIVQQSL